MNPDLDPTEGFPLNEGPISRSEKVSKYVLYFAIALVAVVFILAVF